MRGLSVLAVDRSMTVYPQPRAAHIDGETMRILQSLGVADAVIPHTRPAPPYEFRNTAGEILISVPAATLADDGWPTHLMIYQPGIEQVLRRLCAHLATVHVRLGTSFQRLEQSRDAVTAWLDGVSVSTRMLVGCDGASSTVREAMGVQFDDYGFDEPWLVIDALVLDEARTPAVCLQLCDPARPTTFTLMGPGRLRWEFMLRPEEDPSQMMGEGSIERLLSPWGGSHGLVIERRAVYRFHGLVARHWRDRRVLLAGDAAHLMPPFAGQGLCSGLRDAHNLAWKIDAALRGGPADALLDSYQEEREPHARGIVTMAIDAGRLVCTLDSEVAERRDAKARADREAGVAPSSLALPPLGASVLLGSHTAAGTQFPQPIAADGSRFDDVMGAGAWLISRRRSEGATHRGVTRVDVDDPLLSGFRDALEAWFDTAAVPAVLVRPDRVIFDTGVAEELLASWQRLTLRLHERECAL